MEDLRRNALKEYEEVREHEQKIVRQEKGLDGEIDQGTLAGSNELNKLYGSSNVLIQIQNQIELDDEEDNEAIEQLRELDAKEKKKLKKKQKKRDKKIKQQMAQFSHFGEEQPTTTIAMSLEIPSISQVKRKGKSGNKLSQEEIDNLTSEELVNYIQNEGVKFSPPKVVGKDPNAFMCKYCQGELDANNKF